jgi:hypothetical protein
MITVALRKRVCEGEWSAPSSGHGCERKHTHSRHLPLIIPSRFIAQHNSAPAPDIDWDALTFGIDNVAPVRGRK